jgi:hypothetical protein
VGLCYHRQLTSNVQQDPWHTRTTYALVNFKSNARGTQQLVNEKWTQRSMLQMFNILSAFWKIILDFFKTRVMIILCGKIELIWSKLPIFKIIVLANIFYIIVLATFWTRARCATLCTTATTDTTRAAAPRSTRSTRNPFDESPNRPKSFRTICHLAIRDKSLADIEKNIESTVNKKNRKNIEKNSGLFTQSDRLCCATQFSQIHT